MSLLSIFRSRRRPAGAQYVTVRLPIEIEVEVECEVLPATPPKGPSFECAGGEPGDPGEVNIISVTTDGLEFDVEGLLTDEDYDAVECEAMEMAADAGEGW